MFDPIKKKINIFQFQISSDEEENSAQVLGNENKQFIGKLNPEKITSIDLKIQKSTTDNQIEVNISEQSRNIQKSKFKPLRRNKSFKVKKQENNLSKSKITFNKSVSKFGNIFQEAQQINLKSQSKFAVHQQTKKQVNIGKSIQKKFNQQEIIRKTQQKSILRLSQNEKSPFVPSQSPKKTVRFLQQNQVKFRKTQYVEKPMVNLLEKKLSQTQYRPSSAQRKIDMKVRLKTEEITDMKTFVHKKIKSSQILIAAIKIDQSGFNWFWPVFSMKDKNSGTHILSAKKKAANTTSNFYISTNQKQIDVQNASYMGKVRSNFVGSCFNIFNQGLNPQNIDRQSNKPAKVRQLLATVTYSNQVQNANPKSMRVYMIKHPFTYYDLEGTNANEEEKSLDELYSIGGNLQKMLLLKNRQPTFNKKQNKFQLSFDGKIKKPSTKNFILEDPLTKKQVLLFGKIQQDQYLIEISSPLTPHIAMGIALAQLDNKIVCD